MKKLRDISAIGAKIRSIRRAQGVSQETLAGLAGTGQRYISELERGKETARIREMLKVLDALGAGLYIADQKEAVEWNLSTSS
jgi:y4mF family transcriptional regulator